jgi:lycopene elongase/hydratase (dihydrobisanhydrobacterioruberin-forming)
MQRSKLIAISRPRFWMYLLGPYLIGYALAVSFHGTEYPYGLSYIFLFLLLFTLPANLFLYGINDMYDGDTDRENPKKA